MSRIASLYPRAVVVLGFVLVASVAPAAQDPPVSVPVTALPGSDRQMDNARWRQTVESLGVDPDKVVQPFAVTPEMEAWAQSVTLGVSSPLVVLARIQQALFSDEFIYDPSVTPTAAETFRQRRGNCMAFSVLFVALTRAAGLKTYVVSVPRVEEVSRDGDLVVVSHHVLAGFPVAERLYLYDFYLAADTLGASYQVLDDLSVASLFQSNTAVALLRDGDVQGALDQLEIATKLDPMQPAGWVNLGVARRRLGDAAGALAAYKQALKVAPGFPSALTNLAKLYHEQGRDDEAMAALNAAAQDSKSPFALIALADLELTRGGRLRADRLLRRARRLGRYDPDVYRALARLAQKLGSPEEAERYLERARQLEAEETERVQVLTPGVEQGLVQ